jgi:hypothetical protein
MLGAPSLFREPLHIPVAYLFDVFYGDVRIVFHGLEEIAKLTILQTIITLKNTGGIIKTT